MSPSALTAQLRALGVQPGGVLLVHASFRAVRPVEGGPSGLIQALRDALGPDGTLVMPSWSGQGDSPFDALTAPASPDLGIVADTFWRQPGVRGKIAADVPVVSVNGFGPSSALRAQCFPSIPTVPSAATAPRS